MDEDTLLSLVASGESQTLEFKVSLAQRDAGLKSLCGMVNSEPATGTVIFGVDSTGQLSGVEAGNMDTAQRSLGDVIRAKFDPQLQPIMQVIELQGYRLLIVAASRNKTTPYHEFDGRAYIREGTSTRQLTFEEKSALSRRRNRDLHGGPWRCDRCGAVVGTLSMFAIGDSGVSKTYNHDCGGEFWPL